MWCGPLNLHSAGLLFCRLSVETHVSHRYIAAILMLKQQMARIIARFSDGIGLDDILPIATILHNTVQKCSAWPTPLKRKLLIRALTIIVEKTDIPLIPDELVDPFIRNDSTDCFSTSLMTLND